MTNTQLFDNVLAEVLSRKPFTKDRVVRALVVTFFDNDDDVADSAYCDHDLVTQARVALWPPEDKDV